MDVVGYEITALLGPGTRFQGRLDFEGRVRIDGWFRGEIRSDDTLIVGEGAEIYAEIQVATVIVKGGLIEGNIRATQSIEIHAPARVIGNLHSPSLSIGKGVEFQGTCRMDPVADPEEAPVAVRALDRASDSGYVDDKERGERGERSWDDDNVG